MEEGAVGWNRAYSVEVVDGCDGGVFLLSERGKVLLTGKAYSLLAPLLAASHYDEDGLVEALEGQLAPELVYYALNRLKRDGLVTTQQGTFSPQLAAFCDLCRVSEEEAGKRLQSQRVYLHAMGGAVEPAWLEAFDELGIQRTDLAEEASLTVVLTRDYLDPKLAAYNEFALSSGSPWLLVNPYGSILWIGPLYRPGQTGCHRCLEGRLEANQIEESYVKQRKGFNRPPVAQQVTLTANQKVARGMVAAQVLQYLVTGKHDRLEGKVQTLDLVDLQMREHVLAKQPHCSACGQPPPSEYIPPQLESRGVVDTGGGYRSVTPEETLEAYAAHISPITGVIASLTKSAERGMHVYTGGSNWALPAELRGRSFKSFRVACGGKGMSDMGAKAGCLAEAIERKSGEYHGYERGIEAAYCDIREEGIDPRGVLLYSKAQYLNWEEHNATAHPFHRVSAPFPEDRVIRWTPLWSLTEERVKYLPEALAYFGLGGQDRWYALACSNGCAAGNSLEEAILQGFFELVERDAVAIWWYNRLSMPSVDLRGFCDPEIDRLLQEYAKRGREVWALDLTNDLEIPVFVAVSRLVEGPSEEILFGFGAHLDGTVAVKRALSEMNQFLSTKPFWREKSDDPDVVIIREWLDHATLENRPYLSKGWEKQAADIPSWHSEDLLADIHRCRGRVEAHGMEFLLLDQTRKELGLHVARVVVPGLRHFWPRYAPGRLYDVPVKMGWLKEPLKEADLNPIGIFL